MLLNQFKEVSPMSTKKENKKLAKSIKILASGKIKMDGRNKISLEPFICDSFENAIVSRLDAIISKEDVVIDSCDYRTDVTANMTTVWKLTELLSTIKDPDNQTIIVPVVNKKNALSVFDLYESTVLGSLLRSSTLASIYRKLKPKWASLNDNDKTQFTNVLYIPNIVVFLDEETGKILKRPYQVNLLVVVTPSLKFMSDTGEKVSTDHASKRLICDVFDSAIKCGCKNIVLSPYSHMILSDDPYTTAKLWHEVCGAQRTRENISNVSFAINDDNYYIVFLKSGSQKNPEDVNSKLMM
jgi:hypothetical protein